MKDKKYPANYVNKWVLMYEIYNNQRLMAERMGEPKPAYTLRMLREKLFETHKYDTLYKQWQESGFEYRLCPTVGRIHQFEPYTIDNVQLILNKDKTYIY